MSALTVKSSKHKSGALVVALMGELGMTESEDMDLQFKKILDQKPTLVVLDMSKLELVVSLGMDALVTFQRRIEKAGGKVRLAAIQPMVAESLNRAKLASLFSIFETVDKAVS